MTPTFKLVAQLSSWKAADYRPLCR